MPHLLYCIALIPVGVVLNGLEGDPVPTAFIAETRKSYKDPLVSPVTAIFVAVEGARVNVLQATDVSNL
jgi:hypothetical protein